MSELPEPPDDRELEEFLNRRSDISRVYRAESAEQKAPVALDAPVIAAAAAPIGRARRLQRWRVPVSLAASLIVVFGVLQLAVKDPLVRAPAVPKPEPMAGGPVVDAAAVSQSAPAATAPMDSARVVPGQNAPTAEQGLRARALEKRRYEESEAAAKARAASATRLQATQSQETSASASASAPAPPPPAGPLPQHTATPSSQTASPPEPDTAPTPGKASPPLVAFVSVTEQKKTPSQTATASQAKRTAADHADAAAPASRSSATVVPSPVSRAPFPLLTSQAIGTSAADTGWRAGHYRGLLLGQTTLDDVLRRFGRAQFADETDSSVPLPDGRVRHRLLEYPDRVDPRGSVRLYFDTNSQALASATVTLKPTEPVTEVEREESLTPPVLSRAAEAPLCLSGGQPPSADAAGFPQYRVYPKQGVYLLLTAADAVAEINYFEQCN